ncbi:IPTL-CTERM sorting domain-containing protein [Paracidovorax avenae]|uniref:IPTL-CTERM sorting domain-containing protein n=1 Tax=Paracidovorax avenae TaxID=80867 RepID=UPI000B1A6011|nr:IPTL-CTERM sorting domain-containing protein [Paracidovorax avenae]
MRIRHWFRALFAAPLLLLALVLPTSANAAVYNYSAETDICGAGGLTITVAVGDTVNISDTQNTCGTGNVTGMANRGSFTFVPNGPDFIFRVVTTAAGIGTGTVTWSGGAVFSITVVAAQPIATTQPASAITASGATLNGQIYSRGATTAVAFDYGLSTAYGASIAANSVGASAGTTAVSAPVANLACAATYHYRVRGSNSAGTTNGADGTFTTAACLPPTVSTAPATAISPSSATLNAVVSSNGTPTTVAFEYGASTAYGTSVAASTGGTAPGSAVNAPAAVTLSLACGSTFHFRATAVNAAGTVNGADQVFSTAACPAPAITTAAATAIGQTSATLNALVTANGAQTTVGFEYGPTTAYGTTTAATTGGVAPGSAVGAPASVMVSLACGTTYHFRASAANTGGSVNGADQVFTTAACTPTAIPTMSQWGLIWLSLAMAGAAAFAVRKSQRS